MENNNLSPHKLFPNKLTQKPLMHPLLQLTNTSNLLIWQFGIEERYREAESTCGEYYRDKAQFKNPE